METRGRKAGLWEIETTGKPGVVHLAPVTTTEPLCGAQPARHSHWRTPPKAIRGGRPCQNCAREEGRLQ